MDTFRTSGARTPREAPKVGGYRRGSRVRTTKAGTWFPALSAGDEPAGLLLLHPAVKPAVLKAAIRRLAELRLPGVLPMLPDLVDQAGRNWLVATAAPTPTIADLLDDAGYGTPENAVALAAAVAATLLEVHAEGLAHGAVGAHAVVLAPDGGPMLADWGLDEHASPEGDVAAWAELVELLAARWCASSPEHAAVLARAVNAATAHPTPHLTASGQAGGLGAALAVLTRSEDVTPVQAVAEPVPVRVPEALPEPPPSAASEPPPAAVPELPPVPVSAASEVPSAPATPSPTGAFAPAHLPSSALAPPEAQAHGAHADGSDPPPPPDAPSPARSGRSKTWLARPALLAVLLTAVLVTAAAVIIRPFAPQEQAPPAEPTGPLKVRAVSLAAQMQQSICLLVGTVTTNGQAGRLVYRWVGEGGSQAVSSVSTAGYSYQVEIGLIWSPSSPPLRGSSVTLQILEPQPSTTSTVLPIGCI